MEMGLRSADEYLAGIRDAREVYYRGERVPCVPDHPELGVVARHCALDFEFAEDTANRPLAVHEDGGDQYSAYYRVPRTADDLTSRSRLIEAATAEAATLVTLVKEIGTDALFALMRVLNRHSETEGLRRVGDFYLRCRSADLAIAVAQTDVKGDRRKPPSEQRDPDLFVRVAAKRSDGIVVRGAKIHTSYSPCVDEIIVLPGRSMAAEDAAWSVAFAVPAATKGLTLYATDFHHGTDDPWTRPISSSHKTVETLTVFDDVFVPWERVFFEGRPDLAGDSALAFVEYHRFTAVSYKLPLLDVLIGAAIAVARANGVDKAAHVREKLTWLIGYAESVRGLTHLAAHRAGIEQGIAYPDVLTTNLAKWCFARDFHSAVEKLQDLAGGILVTGPSGKDWAAPEIRSVLEKYLQGAWPADERLAVLNLISDLTARTFGGYQGVLAVHAEGSIEAEKLAMFRSYNPEPAIKLALRLAGIEQSQNSVAR